MSNTRLIAEEWRKYDLLSLPVMDEILTQLPRHYYYHCGMYAMLVNSRKYGFVCNMVVYDGSILISVQDLQGLYHQSWQAYSDWHVSLADADCFWLAAARIHQLRITKFGGLPAKLQRRHYVQPYHV